MEDVKETTEYKFNEACHEVLRVLYENDKIVLLNMNTTLGDVGKPSPGLSRDIYKKIAITTIKENIKVDEKQLRRVILSVINLNYATPFHDNGLISSLILTYTGAAI
jgi:hypothetical protein